MEDAGGVGGHVASKPDESCDPNSTFEKVFFDKHMLIKLNLMNAYTFLFIPLRL